MHFTAKEKKVLIIVGVLLLVMVYLNLFLRPQLKSVSAMKKEINTHQSTYEMNLVYKQKVEGIESQINILSQKLKTLRSIYPPYINYDEVLVVLRNMAQKASLSVENIGFSAATPLIQQNESGIPGKTQAAGTEGGTITDTSILSTAAKLGLIQKSNENPAAVATKVPDGKGYAVGIKMSVNGTNSQLKAFLKSISELKNKVGFRDISIHAGGNEKLIADLAIDFYGIMDRGAEAYSMLPEGTWVPSIPKGKDNIFKQFDELAKAPGAAGNEQIVQSVGLTTHNGIAKSLDAYDFMMRVTPFGNNLTPPAVSLSAKGIASGVQQIPTIYGDSKDRENVELFLQVKSGKYYCKFKTERDFFPDKGYTGMAEFKPKEGTIHVLVDSTGRKFKDDSNTVNFKVVNWTNRNVQVDVVNDDKTNPRVSVTKAGRRVDINYGN